MGVAKSDLPHLLGGDESMLFVAYDHRRLGFEPFKPENSPLQHRVIAAQSMELLRVEMTRQRPEPRAGTSGHDDRRQIQAIRSWVPCRFKKKESAVIGTF